MNQNKVIYRQNYWEADGYLGIDANEFNIFSEQNVSIGQFIPRIIRRLWAGPQKPSHLSFPMIFGSESWGLGTGPEMEMCLLQFTRDSLQDFFWFAHLKFQGAVGDKLLNRILL